MKEKLDDLHNKIITEKDIKALPASSKLRIAIEKYLKALDLLNTDKQNFDNIKKITDEYNNAKIKERFYREEVKQI